MNSSDRAVLAAQAPSEQVEDRRLHGDVEHQDGSSATEELSGRSAEATAMAAR